MFCLLHVGQSYTVSIALPGSILNNVQSFQLKTYLAGQVSVPPHSKEFSSYSKYPLIIFVM